ncbi:MAG: ketoacyl-ACP synthase III [Halobacteriovoraceae bacterium]|nr:ketoacyl-ACP synthase III [Halobacteriovoraceae bacterium]MCB9094175.1 ketoacyl-ACP synthase III [Halobacteriovoraceae bacterium]
MYKTKILATGHCVPNKILTNDDLSKMVDTSDQWITERTGIKERRIADLSKGEYPSTMAAAAAKEAFSKCNLEPNDIDLILFSVTIPDMFTPNTASWVQKHLGITNNCACLDINAACSGYLYGLTVADAFIKAGNFKNILLFGCELTSRFNNWEDRSTCVLFGDGCGVSILTRAEENEASEVLGTVLGCDSSKGEALILRAGGAVKPITHEVLENREQFISMDGQVVFKSAVKTMTSQCAQLLEQTGLTKDDVTWFIPHQANLRIIEAVAHRFEFPKEKTIINVQKYANTSSASIPIGMNEALNDGKINRGDLVLLTAFGGGLTSGTVLLRY